MRLGVCELLRMVSMRRLIDTGDDGIAGSSTSDHTEVSTFIESLEGGEREDIKRSTWRVFA